jgi:polygalacturonase
MLRTYPIILLAFLFLTCGAFAKQYDVTEFGAVGDGSTLDTEAINKAIMAASEDGGGTVYFPAGTFASFSIHLKSNITLHLDNGCTLLAASPDDYPGEGFDVAEPNMWGDSLQYQDFGHSHWQNSLIWGIDLKNIVIEGHGKIDGKGLVKHGSRKPGLGNKAIALKLCRNVTIKDITIFRGGHFGILPTGVENITIDNIKIDSNRDGINIDCCRYVNISNCRVNTPNDDAIVLKSSYALGYAQATENVTITNCHVSGYDLGSMLDGTYQTTQEHAPDEGAVTGRIKFGTESNGGFKNITISNVTFSHCRGLAIESVDGGYIEDVDISDITMRDILDSGFFIRVGSRLRGPDGIVPGKTARINISDVTIEGIPPRYCAMVMGIPGHPVSGVTFDNIKMKVNGGAKHEQSLIEVPENEDGYPDPMYFGELPAHGFFVRHAEKFQLSNIDISLSNEDYRPAIILEDVRGGLLENVRTTEVEGVPAAIFEQVEDVDVVRFNKFENEWLERVSQKKYQYPDGD